MSAFPDIIGGSYKRTPRFKTKIGKAGGTIPHVWQYRNFIYPRFEFQLSWTLLDYDDAEDIRTHIETVGLVSSFDWFDWRAFPWTWVPVGIGDGSAVTFNVPGKETTGQTFYVNGTTPITGTVTAGVGANGADRVTFLSAPADGARISAAFTGRRRFTVSFGGAPQGIVPVADPPETYEFSSRLVEEKRYTP